MWAPLVKKSRARGVPHYHYESFWRSHVREQKTCVATCRHTVIWVMASWNAEYAVISYQLSHTPSNICRTVVSLDCTELVLFAYHPFWSIFVFAGPRSGIGSVYSGLRQRSSLRGITVCCLRPLSLLWWTCEEAFSFPCRKFTRTKSDRRLHLVFL